MDRPTREKLIARYKDGCRVVAEALEGATEPELDARPVPSKWSAREIVHHLADSEMMSAIRLRLLLAEDRPTIQNYDQAEFARRLHYDRPIAASADTFQAIRRATAEIRRSDDRRRAGPGGHAHGARALHRRALAGDLRRPRLPSRRADHPGRAHRPGGRPGRAPSVEEVAVAGLEEGLGRPGATRGRCRWPASRPRSRAEGRPIRPGCRSAA